MPGATPVYGLPYPITSDRLDDAVTTIPHNLALALESTLQAWGGIAAPGAWTTLTLAGGATPFAGYQAPRYRKIGNIVYLQGLISVPAGGYAGGATVATLPVGFRPPAGLWFATTASASGASVDVFERVLIAATGVISIGAAIPAGNLLSISVPPFSVD